MPKAMGLLDPLRYNNLCDSKILNFAANSASEYSTEQAPLDRL
jgi:hypothetical protein